MLVKPYESLFANVLSITNETCFFTAVVIYMWFQRSSRISPAIASLMGFVATALLFLLIIVNMMVIVPLQIYGVYKTIKRRMR